MNKQEKSETNKIAVIGDSHTRAFAFTNIFLPFFLGSGKEHCFINNRKARNVSNKSKKLINTIKKELGIQTYILVFGEPDARWLLGKGWYPWKKKIYNPLIYYKRWKLIEENCYRYINLIKELSQLDIDLIIYGNTSIYNQEQVKLARRWNQLLYDFCQCNKITFVNVLEEIINEEDQVKKEYANDISHASQAVLPLVIKKIQFRGKLPKNLTMKIDKENDHKELKSSFIYNEKFGSFISK